MVRDWAGYIDQKNHAASLAAHDWILSVDADERVTPELAAEVKALLQSDPREAAFRIPRVTWHLGRWIRSTDWYPDYQLRLYDRRAAQWTFGVQIGYPLGASTSQANLARVRLQYDQAQTQLKNIQMQIATQVRGAARNVTTNQQRVQSAKASRELQEKKLEAEEKKMAAGMGQTFFVFQAQRDLSLARTAEILAISDYNKSLVDFEAVQQVPLNGGAQIQVAR